MPRYFFHLLHADNDPVVDEEGLHFEDDAVAKSQASASLRDLLKDYLSSDPAPLSVTLQVVREGVGTINVQTAHLGIEAHS